MSCMMREASTSLTSTCFSQAARGASLKSSRAGANCETRRAISLVVMLSLRNATTFSVLAGTLTGTVSVRTLPQPATRASAKIDILFMLPFYVTLAGPPDMAIPWRDDQACRCRSAPRDRPARCHHHRHLRDHWRRHLLYARR